ncbi:MAG: cyclase family protein [Spirochaetia bacterium]|jgi:kynurenine formamidase|nr:cyclase family protein [Spirochaetia bacterium]
MNTIDLTQFITPDMPVYPGTEGPKIDNATSIAQDGFAEKLLTMYSHTGTHVDAPGHMIPGAKTLDQFSVDTFIGRAVVIDVPEVSEPCISLRLLEDQAERLKGCDFVLFHTGWDAKWGQGGYFSGFPVLSADAARLLCGLGLKGLGFDCISVDPVGSTDMEIHRILLGSGLVIVENLCNLSMLNGAAFTFSCLPLRIRDSDGSPVRAVAMLAD